LLAAGFYTFIKTLEYETANPGQDTDHMTTPDNDLEAHFDPHTQQPTVQFAAREPPLEARTGNAGVAGNVGGPFLRGKYSGNTLGTNGSLVNGAASQDEKAVEEYEMNNNRPQTATSAATGEQHSPHSAMKGGREGKFWNRNGSAEGA
jgi:hypothetical protein